MSKQVKLVARVRREKDSLDLSLVRLTIKQADIKRLLRLARPYRRGHEKRKPAARGDRARSRRDLLTVRDFGIRVSAEQEIGGFGGKACGAENGAVVLAQHGEP